jgi:excisionase family DNA binding protein
MRAGKRVGSLCPDTAPLPFEPPASHPAPALGPAATFRSKLDEQGPRSARYASPDLDPLSVRIPTAVKLTGISRSRIYELIQSGDLETVKIGRSTLIPFRCLKALVRG